MSLPPLIDTHCHLGWKSLEEDLPQVLAQARTAGILAMVDVGIDLASSRRALDRSHRHEGLHPTAGLHPCDCSGHEADFPEISDLCSENAVVAIGETGLDLYWKKIPLSTQRASLDKHLDLARRIGKPMIFHCRDAFPELLDQLQEWAPIHGVLHCFTGDSTQASKCLDLGLHLSFAGPLTYKNNEDLRMAAVHCPTDRLLVETDAPFLPPESHRGRRNEPAFVRCTFETLARIRVVEEGALSKSLLDNSRHLFGLAGTP